MSNASDDNQRVQSAVTSMQSLAKSFEKMAVASQNVASSIQSYAQVARPVYEEFYQRLILKNYRKITR